MRWTKRLRVRTDQPAIDLDAELNAVLAINAGEDGQVTQASSTCQAGAPAQSEQGDPPPEHPENNQAGGKQ